jgi:phenylacetate-coenzyme A ligase PaaK-like adenylate-forming protein
LNIVEAEASVGDERSGPALVTTLYPRYVPLIRYRQGDIIAGIERDEFGLVATFDEIDGRINDMITLADGTSIHSVALAHCFKEESSVFNLQLVLEEKGPVFSVVVEKPLPEATEKRIRLRLGQLHPEFGLAEFIYVDDLASNRAGKRRWVVDRRRQSLPG